MRTPMTRNRYRTRVAKFFDFIGIKGKTIEQKDINFALSFGFRETPSFIVENSNGSNPEMLSGALPFESFKAVIDKKISAG
jgi:protein-disulfide isomerase